MSLLSKKIEIETNSNTESETNSNTESDKQIKKHALEERIVHTLR